MSFIVNPYVLAAAGPPMADIVLWVDAAAASSFSLSGALVEQWNDKSGNLNHLVASTLAGGERRPTKSGSSVIFVTAPVSNGLVCSVPFINSGTAFSYYLAWKRTAQQNDLILIGSGSTYAYLQYVGPNRWLVGNTSQAIGLADNTPVVHGVRSNNVNEAVRSVNGVDQASTGVSGGETISRAIGCTNTYGGGFSGTVYELLVYGARLSDDDNTAVIDYLMGKWGI